MLYCRGALIEEAPAATRDRLNVLALAYVGLKGL